MFLGLVFQVIATLSYNWWDTTDVCEHLAIDLFIQFNSVQNGL